MHGRDSRILMSNMRSPSVFELPLSHREPTSAEGSKTIVQAVVGRLLDGSAKSPTLDRLKSIISETVTALPS